MRDHRHGRNGGSAGAGTARPPGSVGEAQLTAVVVVALVGVWLCQRGKMCHASNQSTLFAFLRQRQDCVEAGSESSFFAKAIRCENGVQ